MLELKTQNWHFLETFFLRSTGFPFSLMTQFRFEKTWNILDQWWEIHSKIEPTSKAVEEEVNKLFRLPEAASVKGQFLNVFRKLNKKQFIATDSWMHAYSFLTTSVEAWNVLLSQENQLLARAKTSFESELMEARQKLRKLLETNVNFREAMFLSSNGSSETAVESYLKSSPDSRNSDTRRRERLFMSYLQRFSTKNETTSFFGPINFGHFRPNMQMNLSISCGKGLNGKNITQSQIFLSHWTCRELLSAICSEAEIRPSIIPHFYPNYTFTQGQLYHFGIERIIVSEEVRQILMLIDGQISFKELLNQFKNLHEEKFWGICNQLAQDKIISNTPFISPFSLDSDTALLQFVKAFPESPSKNKWLERISILQGLKAEVKDGKFETRISALGEMEEYVQAWTGKDPKRGKGSFYEDRSIIFEEARGLIESCQIGGEIYAKLNEGLSQLFSILSLIAIAEWELWQFTGNLVFRKLRARGERVMLVDFWNEFQEIYEGVTASEDYVTLETTIKEAIHSFQEEAQKPNQPLERIYTKVRDTLWIGGYLKRKDYPLCVSPDFLLGGSSVSDMNSGKYKIYVGEIHSHLFTNAYDILLYFYEPRQEHAEALEEILKTLASPSQILEVVFRRNTKAGPINLKGTALFMQEPPSNDNKVCIPITNLEVTCQNDEVLLADRNDNSQTFVIPGHNIGDLNYEFLKIFSLPYISYIPVHSERSSPRLEWNGIVYQRANWRLEQQDLKQLPTASDFELLLEAYKLKRKNEIPDCVFVRNPLEKKPFFLDFKNFMLIELFQHNVRRLPQAWLSEFAPNEEELWLEINGEKYCSEFRTGMYCKSGGSGQYERS